MFRQPSEYNNPQALKELKAKIQSLEIFENIKIPVFIAVIDYYISVMENRSLVGLAFTNFNEREQDIKFFLAQIKTKDNDFINVMSGYIASKPDSSEFKDLVTKALQKAKLNLEAKQNALEYNRVTVHSILSVAALTIVAKNDNENKLTTTLALGAIMLLTYFVNKYPEYVLPIFHKEDFNNKEESKNVPSQIRRI